MKRLVTATLMLATGLAATPGRPMHYSPTPEGYIQCHNGHNLYTRALYGSHSLWRLETSDMPIFAAYHKTDNRNIHFTVTVGKKTLRLDSVADCTALYSGGERIYRLSDSAWGKGTITLTAVADPDREKALWQITASNMPAKATLSAHSCKTVAVKLNRSGDIGADPANCFAPETAGTPAERALSTCTVAIGGRRAEKYVAYADRSVTADDQAALAAEYSRAQAARAELAGRVAIRTPDPYINTVATSLLAAADGIWDGTTYQHGAIGWRMPLSGWRGAYTGDCLGWHDRARTHFDAYATSQVTDVPPTVPHPAQDPDKNLARAEKRWGTQMYSNGYICRNPGRNDQMHHYDMNLCYIDELLRHLQWTGDIEYARTIWPVIRLSLEWEKRNFDPDDDGLYDAYCCIWASDALYYNSAAVTHSTAYNHYANLTAAKIAELIGEDPVPYRREAEKTLAAMNHELWLDGKGVWAEHRDAMGLGLVHAHPGVWTVYHAVDSETCTPEQAYSATGYIMRNIPHIPIEIDGAQAESGYHAISTTDWMPYSWSINNVAFAETYHTALACWQAGRADYAYRLLRGAVLDGMYLGASPGNVGQVSHYDAARGECYRDFADPVGVLSRALVEGLFGYTPRLLERRIDITPGWPRGWDYAEISHPDFSIAYSRDAATDSYTIAVDPAKADSLHFTVPVPRESVKSVKVNGADAPWRTDTMSVGRPTLHIDIAAADTLKITIDWDGRLITPPATVPPQRGEHYRRVRQGDFTWLAETERDSLYNRTYVPEELGTEPVTGSTYAAVDIASLCNARVTDIFHNRYESPRSPYTTLQLPVQGIGEWCHPADTARIADTALRRGTVTVAGVPFTPVDADSNIVYTSLYDNYPDQVTIPLDGRCDGLNLLMAGSTNHMQAYVDNARIDVAYADGTTETLRLVAPYNWCPVEQAYLIDGKAFRLDTPRPYRLTLEGGIASRDLGAELGLDKVDAMHIDGGAATMLAIKLDPEKELRSLTLTAVSNETVTGIAAITKANPR